MALTPDAAASDPPPHAARVLPVGIAELLDHLLLFVGDEDEVQHQEDEHRPCEGEPGFPAG